MLLQRCLKGIPESQIFTDKDAAWTLSHGIVSRWLTHNAGYPVVDGLAAAQQALSQAALDDHVNNYGAVAHNTPYISLSAGSVTPASHGVSVRPAWRTALDFGTRGGMTSAFIFRCWVILSPKPSAGLSSMADEVRELSIFRQFWTFHDEGEVAAKILVPHRQIEWVQKFDPGGNLLFQHDNPDFVDPFDVCNLIEVVT
jgi:hypothetical protein